MNFEFRQEIIDKLTNVTKAFKQLFSRRASLDLTNETTTSSSKHINRITGQHTTLSASEQAHLDDLSGQYASLAYFDQYALVDKLCSHIVDCYKCMEQRHWLPRLQHVQFVIDLMESNMNTFNLLLFCLKLLHMAPRIAAYMRSRLHSSSPSSQQQQRPPYIEYTSVLYTSVIGVLRLHSVSLVLWQELAVQTFRALFDLVRHVERLTRCHTHERCAIMLLNELYVACAYIRAAFPAFDAVAVRIKSEKSFVQAPQTAAIDKLNGNNNMMRGDDTLAAMLRDTEHTIDEIEAYVTSQNCYYNFVGHAFVLVGSLKSDGELVRVAMLCAELTARCHVLVGYWHNAAKALHHRSTDAAMAAAGSTPGAGANNATNNAKQVNMYSELIAKCNVQTPRAKHNYKLFLCMLAARHCLVLNELIIMVVRICVMACPNITPDQSHNFAQLEPSASLACHIIHYLFTGAPRPLAYRRCTNEQRMLTASLRTVGMFIMASLNAI